MESKVLLKVKLDSSINFITGETSHVRDGIKIDFLPHILQIESNPMVENEFYLIHYDENNNEIADTLHDSIEEAMEQAEFEFNVSKEQWVEQ